MMSPLLIQIFFRSLPRIRPRRLTPSKHCKIKKCSVSFRTKNSTFGGHASLENRELSYHGLESAVAQHLQNLGIFLPFLLEDKLALLIAVATHVSDEGGVRGITATTHSFSFFPLRRFLPPFPLFFGMLTGCAQIFARKSSRITQKIV